MTTFRVLVGADQALGMASSGGLRLISSEAQKRTSAKKALHNYQGTGAPLLTPLDPEHETRGPYATFHSNARKRRRARPGPDDICFYGLFCRVDDLCHSRPADSEGTRALRDSIRTARGHSDPDRIPFPAVPWNMG